MSEQTIPPILLEFSGVEDFPGAVAMLRATGARRWNPGGGRAARRGSGSTCTFAIDHEITAQQAASLIEFIEYGVDNGILKVTVNAPELDEDGVAEWWETA